MEKWLPFTEACPILEISESTLRRRIQEGKYESKLEEGRRYVLVDMEDESPSDDSQATASNETLITHLESEIEYLRRELTESRQRSDAIIMKVTQQLEHSEMQLQDMRKKRTVWQKVKDLFAPEGLSTVPPSHENR